MSRRNGTFEARRFIRSRLTALIAATAKGDFSQVMCNIRTRLSIEIMRSVAVRGVRWKAKKASSVPFNLIPDEKSFENIF